MRRVRGFSLRCFCVLCVSAVELGLKHFYRGGAENAELAQEKTEGLAYRSNTTCEIACSLVCDIERCVAVAPNFSKTSRTCPVKIK